MSVYFDSKREGRNVITTYTGENEAVQRSVDQLFSNFNPAGYNTRVTKDVILETGLRQVTITRWDSCD